MKQLFIYGNPLLDDNGNPILAEKIVPTQNDIIGYNGNAVVFAFRGVNDFDAFTCDGPWDTDETTQLRQQVQTLTEQINSMMGGT
jgi:hypothetical protein